MIVIIKRFFIDFFSIIRSICIIACQVFSKRETRMYPEVPCVLSPRYRGRIVLTSNSDGHERCVACNLCAVACPVGCISLKKGERQDGRWYPEFFRINFSRCIFCGMCEEACPTGAIQLTQDFDMCDFDRSSLVYEKEHLLVSGQGKFLEYDFFQVSGVSVDDKGKGEAQNEFFPISVRDIMP